MANPTTPLPGVQVDIELNAIRATVSQILTNLALIQRDDGEIGTSLIGLDQLDGSLISLGFDRPSNWATATVYEVDSAVFESNKLYVCLVAHTSNVFSTDLANVKWIESVDFSTLITAAEAAAADATSQAAAASGSASAAAASAVDAAAALADAVLKSGSTMTGELTLTGSGSAALHAATIAQVQKNIVAHSTAEAGTVDAIQVTMSPASTTWTADERICWTSVGQNTITTPVISKDGGVSSKTIKKGASAALAAGDTGSSGYECEGRYNGTYLILLNPATAANYTVAAQTEETVPVFGDFVGGYDVSGAVERKFKIENLFKVINGLTEDAGPDVDADFFSSYDTSASSGKKVKIRSMLKTLNALTEDATPDAAADFLLSYDTSASDVKKVKPSSIGLQAATQAEQEAGSSTAAAATPGRQHFHPSAAKCWAVIDSDGTPVLSASYNITSISDADTGRVGITIATDFSSAVWAGLVATDTNGLQADISDEPGVEVMVSVKTAGTCELATYDFNTGVIEDNGNNSFLSFVGFGDLA